MCLGQGKSVNSYCFPQGKAVNKRALYIAVLLLVDLKSSLVLTAINAAVAKALITSERTCFANFFALFCWLVVKSS